MAITESTRVTEFRIWRSYPGHSPIEVERGRDVFDPEPFTSWEDAVAWANVVLNEGAPGLTVTVEQVERVVVVAHTATFTKSP